MARPGHGCGNGGTGAGWGRQWGLWKRLNQGSTDKGDQGKGTAVPMADNGLERRWTRARVSARQVERRLGTAAVEMTCHAPTRLADPNRVRGARLRTGTLYLFFFLKPKWYLWVWPTLIIIQNIIYKSKELPPEWCPSKSIHI